MINFIIKLSKKYKFINRFLNNLTNAYVKQQKVHVIDEKTKSIENCKNHLEHISKSIRNGKIEHLRISHQGHK